MSVSSQIGQSHLALKYVFIPVNVTKLGVGYNPTGDTVQFCFMPTATQVPQPSDLISGSWDTYANDILYPYHAKCLVGPGGAINLGIGLYIISIKITDSPEIPFDIVGQLQVS